MLQHNVGHGLGDNLAFVSAVSVVFVLGEVVRQFMGFGLRRLRVVNVRAYSYQLPRSAVPSVGTVPGIVWIAIDGEPFGHGQRF